MLQGLSKFLISLIAGLIFSAQVFADPMSCPFNWDTTQGNWRTGALPTSTPREAASGQPNQGYVQDFGDEIGDESCENIASGVNRAILRNDRCVDGSAQELTSIHCAGVAGNGFSYGVQSLNINQFNDYWDQASEELVFETAIEAAH